MLERFANDVRLAARSLRRSPGFTCTAVLVLALGIGATTAVFSVARGVLLRPLPFSEPEQLVQFVSQTQTGRAALASMPKYQAWREGVAPGVLSSIAAYHSAGPGVTLTSGGRQIRLDALYVAATYFDVFRAPVMLGRTFDRGEDQPQGPNVAVISYRFWLREFGATRSPIGEVVSFGNEPYSIIGVLGAAFESLPAADVWLPLRAPLVSFNHTNYLTVVGRLRPGVSIGTADRQARNASVPFRRTFPWAMGPWEEFGVAPLQLMIAGDSRGALQMLSGAVGFMLLIACANVANLFSVRALRRKPDIATRAALGAGRLRLVRQLFAECVLLAVSGAVLGVAAGHVALGEMLATRPTALPAGATVTLDFGILGFALFLSVMTAIAFGMMPVLVASRVDLSSFIKEGTAHGSTGARPHRSQSFLVVLEMGLAIVLLVGAGMLLRTFVSLRAVNPGFEALHLLTVEMPLNDARFQNTGSVAALVRDAESRIDALPGVGVSAVSYGLPLDTTVSLPFTLHNRPLLEAPYHGVATWRTISPGYFDAFRIRVVKGRVFNRHDDAASEPVVVINQMMARKFWQWNDPLGERLRAGNAADKEFDEPPRRIVGVVGDVHDTGINRAPEPMMYVPLAQTTDRMTARNNRFLPLTWIVRTSGEPITYRSMIERELGAASGGLPVARVRSMQDIVRAATAQLEFTAILITLFAASSLVLAGVGVYGLMAFSVQQRRQELGIRLALGAGPARVRNMVLLQGARLTAIGVSGGLGAAVVLSRVMNSLVFGASASDVTVYAGVGLLLSLVGLAASSIPALHATHVDPMRTLRS
jgi:putative ABC transport system permease protein